MEFKDFILHEHRVYLGQKVGDILTAVHDLRDDAKSMGSRNLVRYSEKVANQIRRILHSHWPREDHKFLKPLQKVGVAIMKAIEEKDDLEQVIAGAATELERLAGKLGVPLHKLGIPEKEEQGPPQEKAQTSQPQQDNAPPGPPPGVAPPGPVTTGPAPAGENPIGQPPTLGGF